jgi:YD repeat-containing protein
MLFDGDGRLVALLDPSESGPQLAYDASTGRLTSVTDSSGNALTFRYDSTTGRLVGVDDELDLAVVTYGYDDLGRLSSVANRSGAVTQFSYDADGDYLLSIRDQLGAVVVRNVYDGQGRVIMQTDGQGDVTRIRYTRAVEDDSETTVATYTVWIDPATRTVEVGETYDANGWLRRRVVKSTPSAAGAQVVDFAYDADGFPVQQP